MIHRDVAYGESISPGECSAALVRSAPKIVQEARSWGSVDAVDEEEIYQLSGVPVLMGVRHHEA